jgi:hypothetical protein
MADEARHPRRDGEREVDHAIAPRRSSSALMRTCGVCPAGANLIPLDSG